MRPTPRLRAHARRALTDIVTVSTSSTVAATRATMASGTLTLTDPQTWRASVRTETLTDQDDQTIDRSVRDLSVWIDDASGVVAGQQMSIGSCPGDATLVGKTGTVLLVERDSIRAIRRCTVRLSNDE